MSDPVGALANIATARADFDKLWQGDGPKRVTIDAGITGPGFGSLLTDAIGRVSDMQDTAGSAISAFARGENVELHQVMAASEEAGIALEMMVELRNKVLDAYHTLVGMQA